MEDVQYSSSEKQAILDMINEGQATDMMKELRKVSEKTKASITDIIATTKDEDNRTIGHHAARACNANSRTAFARALMAFDADPSEKHKKSAIVNDRDKNGNGLMHEACRSHNGHMVRLLAMNGALLGATNDNGESAAHKAVLSGSLECLTRLVEANAPLGVKIRTGRTALHHAAEVGDLELVDAILASGRGDAAARDQGGKTAKELAEDEGHGELEALFLPLRLLIVS